MLSGRENVGAAINEPCFWLVSNFSTKAERWTVSRQRPLYFDFAIQLFQKRDVCWKRSSTKSISGCCPSGRMQPKIKIAFSPACKVNREIDPCVFCSRAAVEYRAIGEQSSLGKNLAQPSDISVRCGDLA